MHLVGMILNNLSPGKKTKSKNIPGERFLKSIRDLGAKAFTLLLLAHCCLASGKYSSKFLGTSDVSFWVQYRTDNM